MAGGTGSEVLRARDLGRVDRQVGCGFLRWCGFEGFWVVEAMAWGLGNVPADVDHGRGWNAVEAGRV